MERLMMADEVCEYLRVSDSTLWRGGIPYRLGRCIWFLQCIAQSYTLQDGGEVEKKIRLITVSRAILKLERRLDGKVFLYLRFAWR